ncbi:M14 family metallopeptidase [Flectobacillus roseus]|uniref:M14 family metallopeptidase n=1 Tax=Flectobacillus roseus TaxID=502259 RepID=A0ABT6Y2B7_9BACT|nr:M14 family metallopeptidase [Flectobacillus roseus]MDI9857691.1 M14 family metallopeptidase [Flectobacillus roseus]
MKKYISLFLLSCSLGAAAQEKTINDDLTGLRAIGTPASPKVKISWNHYNDYAMITRFCQDLAKAYPDLVKVESMGKSTQGKDMWVLTISDFKSGSVDRKPGFYIDGNIHSNEIQGTEVAMYTAWYLAESFNSVDFIKQLLKDKVFYIVPTINPDAREDFLKNPNTPHSPRSGMLAFDDDGDGKADEDKFDDLDGDGNIVMMRRKTPYGRWKVDCDNPQRMIPAKPDEKGEYEMLGYEGIDNDGDGAVNEDLIGYYDPNRDWGWNWQPDYIQRGALYHPGTLAETRNIKNFVYAHPNIAGAQSYHNNGGMFLRGPGAEEDAGFYVPQDGAVYDYFGKIGEKINPGYKYFVIYKDLYTVYGGEIDWLALGRGVFTFSTELFTSYKLFGKQSEEGRGQNNDFEEFSKNLLFNDAYVAWKPFKHPQYGDIEIGGPKKNYTRNHPGFMLEEDAHRNMAFTVLHASQMPKLEVSEIRQKALAGGFTEVTAVVTNSKVIPTHSAHDLKYKIERPDYISLKNANVVAGMIVENEDINLTKEQKYTPQTIEVSNISGMSAVKVRWIVKGKLDKATVEVDSQKGGLTSKSL